ncbi:hypothetical protein GGS26DRAFT_558168 [Hypomontagnella submonticulosa]|nr:hypothetical protein GGS26DRAFT_558168 [Hypomontagnella submonticulosa]
MWAYISSFFKPPPASPSLQPPSRGSPSEPPPVEITVARFPVDGSPYLMTLKTTSELGGSTDQWLFHVPDVRPFWKSTEAWDLRDNQRLELQNGRSCDGVYIVFFSFALIQPENKSFPPGLCAVRPRGDVFVAKLQPHEYGQYAWAAYDNVSEEFLNQEFITRREYLRWSRRL